jgi:sugar lactone lactonase YvrE
MKTLGILACSALGLAASTAALSPAVAQTVSPAACAPEGDLKFVCGLTDMEDFLPVDGGRYLVGGSLKAGAGGLFLVDTAAKTARPVTISLAARRSAGDPACGPPDLKTLATHGLDVKPGRGGTATVYAVSHRAGGDAVELFRLDPIKGAAEWTGCVTMPAGASANSVAGLPDGSIVVTKFYDTRGPDGMGPIMQGRVTGVVYHWAAGRGMRVVPGTALSGDNGLGASPDGKTLYVNAWGSREVWKIPLSGRGRRTRARVEFNPDNLRWAPDGSILIGGQYMVAGKTEGPNDWGVARLDPKTMTVIQILKEPGTKTFDNATSAVQIGDTLWFGTFRGDRIAYRTAP